MLLYSLSWACHDKNPRFPRNDSSLVTSSRKEEISIASRFLRNRRHSSAVVEKVFFLEVRPVFCYWINPRPALDAAAPGLGRGQPRRRPGSLCLRVLQTARQERRRQIAAYPRTLVHVSLQFLFITAYRPSIRGSRVCAARSSSVC